MCIPNVLSILCHIVTSSSTSEHDEQLCEKWCMWQMGWKKKIMRFTQSAFGTQSILQ